MGRRFAVLCLLLLLSIPVFSSDKLIALTFDDGPRPYVLFGTKTPSAPGLLDVLDQHKVKATFFVMGWRLTPKTWGDRRYETNIGITCIDAAREMLKRGHQLEDHTYSHVELRSAERKKGLSWVVSDVEQGSKVIQSVTGSPSRYIRPPDWILPDDARRELESRGYKVLTISNLNPLPLRDVNSLDYLCAGRNPKNCPTPSLSQSVLRQIDAREKKGVFTHILAFHELTSTTAAMPELLKALKARGYRFVTVTEYMRAINERSPTHVAMNVRK
ncbi:MAG TPA: polysaccharide deacetylase family protein [Terriglobales bacterium]|nr:polysaccharide deacetylase family protein [Terriglobales bacterium]